MNMKSIAMVAAAAATLSSLSLRADETQTFYGIYNADGTFSWTNSVGESVSWVSGSIAWFTAIIPTGNKQNVSSLTAYGLVFDAARKSGFWSDGNRFTIGAGGVTFRTDATFAMGRNSFTDMRFAISADQTWQGPATGSYADLSIGYGSYNDYWRMPLMVGEGVHNLEIKGNLNVWLLSPSNDLSAVDVTLKSPARLYLPSRFTVGGAERFSDAHLRARRLTLDGATMKSGGTQTYYNNAVVMSLVEDFDAEHIAQTLVLSNGASVVATGTCRLSIPSIVAGGEGAANTMSGNFAVTRENTGIELADGASLAFADSICESGVSASFSVSGDGSLCVPASVSLSGGLSLGGGVSLVVTGGGVFSCAVTGGKEIVSDAPGATNVLTVAAMEGFTGSRIVARSGALLLVGGRPAGVDIVVEEGASLLDNDPMVVTDTVRSEPEIVVGSNQTLRVYGDGLTAATTVVLDGGTMLFGLPATVSSPVQVCQRSEIATESLAVTGVVAGAVNCAITNETFGLHVSGDGCVKFAGGATFAGDKTTKTTYDTFYVDQGSVLLTNGKYKFGWGGLLIQDPDESDDKWGRYLGVMDGGEVSFADQGNGSGGSREVIRLRPKPNPTTFDNAATFEVGTGGKVTLPWNCQVHLGSRSNVGRILINGGEWRVNGKYHLVYFTSTYGSYVTGIIEVRAGLMEISEPLRTGRGDGQARLIWSGGTIKPVANFLEGRGTYLYAAPTVEYTAGGPLRVWVQIVGEGSTLDLSDYPAATFSGVPVSGCDRSEWFGNGTLTVKGGKTFVMPSFPAGASLVADGGSTRIVVPSNAKVFDNEKCVENMDAPPYPLNYYSSAGAEISGALPVNVFAVTNGAAVISNQLAGATTAIAAVEVRKDGVWANAETVAGDDVVVTNMAFREGSVLKARVNGGKTQTLDISGVLTLPTAAVFNAVKDASAPAVSPVVIRAGGGIVGEAQWSGSRTPTLRVDGDGLVLNYSGLMFVVR